ncbi:hypothetical protein BH23GEM6_BH23GEM6_04050 [soil metagenome]
MRFFFVLLALLTALPLSAPAQTAAPAGVGWDGERPLELIRRAQDRRATTLEDTALLNYSADARAFLYFYLDREDTGERNLIKTDQVALEVFWQAPDQVKQRIVGWRDQRSLPTRIHYHIDHLSVVQENFGDEIQLGDGDEVRGVPHPAAPGSEQFYQFQLVDSLTLRLPGSAEPVQVYQVQTRPRDPSRPGIIGSVFIDRRSGDLVRMDFTFTAASYIDPYLDYINISLDNGLWRGRFWLPNEQRVELRRRLPMLDVPAGTIIRANMRVSNYDFNQPLSPTTFLGPSIVAVSRAEREAFAFEEEIFEELRQQGLGPEMELGEIRRMAAQLAQRQALQRASALRLGATGVSDLIRFNSSEGLALGAGVVTTPHPITRLQVGGGYAFGAEHPFGSLSLALGEGPTRVQGEVYLNQPTDVAVGPVVSGLVNTLSATFAAHDFTDLYFASGGGLSLTHTIASWNTSASLRRESHRSRTGISEAPLGGTFRPSFPFPDGDLTGGQLSLQRRAAFGTARWTTGELRLEGGTFRTLCQTSCPPSQTFGRSQAEVLSGWRWRPALAELELQVSGGYAGGDPPLHQLFFLGGRGTIPGYSFRSMTSDRYLLGRATGSAEVDPTWLRARAHAGLGWMQAGASTQLRPSVGIGVGLLHDILHVDLHRGLGSAGRWELIVESNRGFWDFL